MKKLIAIAALAVALALPAGVFADSSSSTETLTIPNVMTLAGVPASLTYGPVLTAAVTYYATPYTLTFGATGAFSLNLDATGFDPAIQASRFINMSGGTDPALVLDGVPANQDGTPATDYAVSGVGGAIPSLLIAHAPAGVGNSDMTVIHGLAVGHLVAGAFAASLTWSIQ